MAPTREARAGMVRADLERYDTFPKLLGCNAALRGDRPAMREKTFGIWPTWSWKDAAAEIRDLACGLAAPGVQRGDKVARAAQTRPRNSGSTAAGPGEGSER